MKTLEKNQLLIDSLEKKVQEWRELAKVDKKAMRLPEVCGLLSPELEYLIQESWSNQDIAKVLQEVLSERRESNKAQELLLRSPEAKEYDLKSFLDEFHQSNLD